eukprot:763647-Hanusia_phi.AAC.2
MRRGENRQNKCTGDDGGKGRRRKGGGARRTENESTRIRNGPLYRDLRQGLGAGGESRGGFLLLALVLHRRRSAFAVPPPLTLLLLVLVVIHKVGGASCLEQRVELAHRQVGRAGLVELGQSLLQRPVADPHHLSDLRLRAVEPVHLGCDDQPGPADPRRSPSCDHPLPVHPRHDPQRRVCNLVGLVVELQHGGEAADVEGGVDGVELDVELLAELEEDVAQVVHVDLKDLGKVNEHVRRLQSPAHDVEASCNHAVGPPPLDEVLLHRLLEEAVRDVHVVARQPKTPRDVLDDSLPVG